MRARAGFLAASFGLLALAALAILASLPDFRAESEMARRCGTSYPESWRPR